MSVDYRFMFTRFTCVVFKHELVLYRIVLEITLFVPCFLHRWARQGSDSTFRTQFELLHGSLALSMNIVLFFFSIAQI